MIAATIADLSETTAHRTLPIVPPKSSVPFQDAVYSKREETNTSRKTSVETELGDAGLSTPTTGTSRLRVVCATDARGELANVAPPMRLNEMNWRRRM